MMQVDRELFEKMADRYEADAKRCRSAGAEHQKKARVLREYATQNKSYPAIADKLAEAASCEEQAGVLSDRIADALDQAAEYARTIEP